jgi:DNA-binding NarL/FixJ family response regulator
MKLGCSGYLTKKMRRRNIVETIHAVSRGRIFCKAVREKYLIPLQRQLKIN